MQDTKLWQLLQTDVADAAELHPLLQELCAAPFAERLPFLGALLPLFKRPEPDVRAAAVTALAGATGYLSLRQIVRSLDDEDAPVRLAAVESLRASCSSDAARLVHAMFHPRPDVRQVAVQNTPPGKLAWPALLLLEDEHCRAHVQGDLPAKAPTQLIFAIFDLVDRAAIRPEQARALIAEMPAESWFDLLERMGPRRDDAELRHLVQVATEHTAHAPDVLKAQEALDRFDQILELFWNPHRAEILDSAEHQFFARLTKWIINARNESRSRRMLCSLFVVAARKGNWDPLAAQLAQGLCPRLPQLKWIDARTRRAAVQVFYDHGATMTPFDDQFLTDLIQLPLCRRSDGHPDLWTIGGLLRRTKQPYALAERVLGAGPIAAAFLAHPNESAPFFTHPGDSAGRTQLIKKIVDRSDRRQATVLASLAILCPADSLEFLDALDERQSAAVYAALIPMTLPANTISDNKIRRIVEALSPRLFAHSIANFLRVSLDSDEPHASALALRMLGEVAKLAGAEKFAATAKRLDTPRLRKLTVAIGHCAGFPFGCECNLAIVLSSHPDPEVKQWATTRVAGGPVTTTAPRSVSLVRTLSEPEVKAIVASPNATLETAIAPALSQPTRGLTGALGARAFPPFASVKVCAALLGSHDSAEEVAKLFHSYSRSTEDFLNQLEKRVVETWCWNKELGFLGNCWLHRWDPHCFAAGLVLVAWDGGFVHALRWAAALPSAILADQVFACAEHLLSMWRYREKAQLAKCDLPRLAEYLTTILSTDLASHAAEMLVTIWQSKLIPDEMARLHPAIASQLVDLSQEVRRTLSDWIDSRGLPASSAAKAVAAPPDPAILRRIAVSIDHEELAAFCHETHPRIVQDAALRLIELGRDGVARLAKLLLEVAPPTLATVIADSIPLWPDAPALEQLRQHFLDSAGSDELLFCIGASLAERGDRSLLQSLVWLCLRPSQSAWFRDRHWDRLLKLGIPLLDLSIALAVSPHPHAYQAALECLLTAPQPDEQIRRAVADFLLRGTERLHALRLRAARFLHAQRDYTGFPLLIAEQLSVAHHDTARERAPNLLAEVPAALVRLLGRTVLTAGSQTADESHLLDLLAHPLVDEAAREEAYAAILKDCGQNRIRSRVIQEMRLSRTRTTKLQRLARTFAWGVVTGRELTGRLFAVEMNSGEGLGYTRLDTDTVWITPLPILAGQRYADEITRGLIVHEFGHHLYHRGPKAKEVWDTANREGYHGLLNLVSDEHLERNLRATDDRFGDDLKKLGAFAFQHADKEVPVESLLGCLQLESLPILSGSPPAVARNRGCVTVKNGQILTQMEQRGMSFARFVRALRMGLGNRHNDPKVALGLELFKGGFRRHDMNALRDVTLKLREIFGWQTIFIETFGQDAVLTPEAASVLANGEGITADELREAIRRLLQERKKRDKEPESEAVRTINTGNEESFRTITTVVPVDFDPQKHAAYAAQVARDAAQMRRYLEKLGLRLEPQRFRVQGKSLDRTRLVPVVLRGDPRMLIARQWAIRADLFLGLIIDCSGSMQISSRIERAKLFGTLLAEAAKGLCGIDVRVFGFTDSVIYDAGDARRCAAHSLRSSGGNNDAGALWHAAQVARASRRRAKLLVMISDGAPTECTTGALKGLVRRLTTRMNICCAQVAVCPLEVKCFPHYIELPESDQSVAIRSFGTIIMKLVHKAIRGT